MQMENGNILIKLGLSQVKKGNIELNISVKSTQIDCWALWEVKPFWVQKSSYRSMTKKVTQITTGTEHILIKMGGSELCRF